MKSTKIIILTIGFSLILTACFPTPTPTPAPSGTPIPTNTLVPTGTPPPTQTPTVVTLQISQPIEGAKINQTETVKGNSQNIPAGSVIWIVVFLPSTGRYYPQNFPADVQANGDWTSLCYIGQANDSGLKAEFIVVLADKSAQDAFNAYLQDAKDKNDYSGLERLPAGATIYQRISVTRK